jgi:crotonobetaine/carnitine-CoA ligase
MGQWDDKFERAERKWASWKMQEYAQADRVIGRIIEDKARRQPYREVFQFRDRVITYEQLNLLVNRVANSFIALDIRPEDKVALMLSNRAEFLLPGLR